MQNDPISLKKIQHDLIIIVALLNKTYFKTSNSLELSQDSKFIQNKLLETMQILLKLFSVISEKHPQSNIIDHLSTDFKNDFKMCGVVDFQNRNTSKPIQITQLKKTISNIAIRLDRSAIHCKFCPELGIRPYVPFIAKALCIIFELQHYLQDKSKIHV
ncbi:hypothetical protein EXU29_08300 [Acinetobacter wuhouensis]|uniref:hypothetical protein n=1 Tax=Acinetobacter wuhouensis TaxID=1879050 RepID=UPI001022C406|nr:hypothetical protein [Acinetobacter wuhouensis]RZG73322.1 hypothetical protein EXU29_08300 [Acinetobacter wuhouensis]